MIFVESRGNKLTISRDAKAEVLALIGYIRMDAITAIRRYASLDTPDLNGEIAGGLRHYRAVVSVCDWIISRIDHQFDGIRLTIALQAAQEALAAPRSRRSSGELVKAMRNAHVSSIPSLGGSGSGSSGGAVETRPNRSKNAGQRSSRKGKRPRD